MACGSGLLSNFGIWGEDLVGAHGYRSFCLMFLTLRCKKKGFADSVLFSRINGGRTSVLVGEEDS